MTSTTTHRPSLAVFMVGSLAAVALNLLFGTLVGYLALPHLFLDTIGTFVASAAFGFWSGAGVITNLLLTITLVWASFWPRFGTELVDKTATAIIALGILAVLPAAMKRGPVETEATELQDVAA